MRMTYYKYCLGFLALSLLISSTPAAYAAPQKSAKPKPTAPQIADPLKARTNQIVEMLKGKIPLNDYFTADFLIAVPPTQFKTITQSFVETYGQPLRVIDYTAQSANAATMRVAYEKAVATIDIVIEPQSPHKVSGLLAKNFEVNGDSLAAIGADINALPGRAGYIVAELDDRGGRRLIAGNNVDEQFAIGSTFKLYILAELANQVATKQRMWSDVVPLSQRSFSSAATNGWPKDSPVTLQTLALQMISVSDNSATDTLLHVLGQSAVERKLATIGHGNPDKALPFLSTVEAFALKSPSNTALRNRYLAATEAQQRTLLEQERSKLGFAQVENATFDNGPVFIDSLEWFASPSDIVSVLNHFRVMRNDAALQILSVSPGVAPAVASKWTYLGYKGGSEPGVISMSFLAYSKSGKYYVISGSWNDPAKDIDKAKFANLMTRLLNKMAE